MKLGLTPNFFLNLRIWPESGFLFSSSCLLCPLTLLENQSVIQRGQSSNFYGFTFPDKPGKATTSLGGHTLKSTWWWGFFPGLRNKLDLARRRQAAPWSEQPSVPWYLFAGEHLKDVNSGVPLRFCLCYCQSNQHLESLILSRPTSLHPKDSGSWMLHASLGLVLAHI